MWFEQLTGFKESSPEQVRNNIRIERDTMISSVNGRQFVFGNLEIVTLQELRNTCPPIDTYSDKVHVEEIVADVQVLHKDIEYTNSLFQAASQFNLLEMVNPNVTPEDGIDGYEYDYTQGPACAIACGAGTIYRNYFVQLDDQIGQTEHKQVDCLDLIGQELKNEQRNFWQMKNGYALMDQNGLITLNRTLSALDLAGREKLKDLLQVGIQWNTEVTLAPTKHKVSQIYCSALPVAYSSIESFYWESFARLILEATYEATLYAALLNYSKTGSKQVFLTLVGGGAFGNEDKWIFESMQYAIRKFMNTPLQIKVVSYGQSNPNLVNCLRKI